MFQQERCKESWVPCDYRPPEHPYTAGQKRAMLNKRGNFYTNLNIKHVYCLVVFIKTIATLGIAPHWICHLPPRPSPPKSFVIGSPSQKLTPLYLKGTWFEGSIIQKLLKLVIVYLVNRWVAESKSRNEYPINPNYVVNTGNETRDKLLSNSILTSALPSELFPNFRETASFLTLADRILTGQ